MNPKNNSKFLVVENLTNGAQGIRDRVLIVVHNGWLSVFGPKRFDLLLEKEYLVLNNNIF
jgi:hypothetical protein